MKLKTVVFAVLVAALAAVSITRIYAQTPGPQNCPGYGMMGGRGYGTMMGGANGYGLMRGMRGPADREYMQSMWSMQRGMYGQAFTGNADHDFIAMMIPHHQAAIDMARAELRYGKNPKLRAMAQGIIKAQQAEIDQMRAMLR